jgi:hypothetical protein
MAQRWADEPEPEPDKDKTKKTLTFAPASCGDMGQRTLKALKGNMRLLWLLPTVVVGWLTSESPLGYFSAMRPQTKGLHGKQWSEAKKQREHQTTKDKNTNKNIHNKIVISKCSKRKKEDSVVFRQKGS